MNKMERLMKARRSSRRSRLKPMVHLKTRRKSTLSCIKWSWCYWDQTMWDCKSWAVRSARRQSVRRALSNRKLITTTSWSSTLFTRRRCWRHPKHTRQSTIPSTRLLLKKIRYHWTLQAKRRRIRSEILLSTFLYLPIPMKRLISSTLRKQCTLESLNRKRCSESSSANSSPSNSCPWTKLQFKRTWASSNLSRIVQCTPRTTWLNWFANWFNITSASLRSTTLVSHSLVWVHVSVSLLNVLRMNFATWLSIRESKQKSTDLQAS